MMSFRSQELLDQLKGYKPFDERERVSLERTLKLLSSSGDVFDREYDNHHITGSSYVLSSEGLLLHFHKKIPLWIQPGGHVDAGETAREAAIRETIEETGVVAEFESEIFHIDVHDTPAGHVHYDIRYKAWSDSTMLRPPLGESHKVAWFRPGAIAALPDVSNHGAFLKLLTTDFA